MERPTTDVAIAGDRVAPDTRGTAPRFPGNHTCGAQAEGMPMIEVLIAIRDDVDACSAELLRYARCIKANERTLKSNQMGPAEINRDACKSLELCVALRFSPPPNLLLLVAEQLGVKMDESAEGAPTVAQDRELPARKLEAWDEAVRYESEHPSDPTGKRPSTAKLRTTADKAGIDHKTLRAWRATPAYRADVNRNRLVRIKEGLPLRA